MKYIILLGWLIITGLSNKIVAQNNIDSAFNKKVDAQKKVIAAKKDSLKNNLSKQIPDSAQKVKFKSDIKNKIAIDTNRYKHLDDKAKNKIGDIYKEQKNKLPNKEKINGIVNAEKQAQKEFIKSTFNSFTKFNPTLSGQMALDMYATNAQNPLRYNQPVYARLYGNPSFSAFGLPFVSQFYLTTEQNTLFNPNTYTIKLDVQTLKKNMENKWRQHIIQTKMRAAQNKQDLTNSAKEITNIKKQIDSLKKVPALPNIHDYKQRFSDEINTQIANQKQAIIKQYENEKNKQLEKIKNLPEKEKQKLLDSLNRLQQKAMDSIENKKNAYIDSAKNKADNYKDSTKNKIPTLDSNQIKQLQSLQEKLELAQALYEKYKNLQRVDSLLGEGVDLNNPKQMQEFAKNHAPNSLMKYMMYVQDLNAGLVNPVGTPLVLGGVPVRGADITVGTNQWYTQVSAGKTLRNQLNNFINQKPKYERNFIYTQIGFGNKDSSHVAINFMYQDDPTKELNPFIPIVQNTVGGISGKWTKTAKEKNGKNSGLFFNLEGEYAISNYGENLHLPQTEILLDSQKYIIKAKQFINKAWMVKAEGSPWAKSSISFSLRQIDPGYKTLGNPFLRNNLREAELKYKQEWWKGNIKTQVFYKENRDNVLNFSKQTTRLQGAGFRLSTHFKKLPKLNVSYTPYNQGNNHSDTNLRTRNQFAVTNATISYNKRIKQYNLASMLSYTQSTVQLDRGANTGTLIKMRLLSASQTVFYKGHTQVMMQYTQSTTDNKAIPQTDTNNNRGISIQYSRLINRKVKLGAYMDKLWFANGGTKYGAGINAQLMVFKQSSVNIQLYNGRLIHLWGFEDKDIREGRVMWVVSF